MIKFIRLKLLVSVPVPTRENLVVAEDASSCRFGFPKVWKIHLG